jgi:hypothetical protein
LARIQKLVVPTDSGWSLAGLRLVSPDSQGLVVVPPLVGGTALQAIDLFRTLRSHGMDIASFDYSGHASSGGHFSLGQSILDTGAALRFFASECRRDGQALFGAGMSYGTIPLLTSAASTGWPLQGIVVMNGLLDVRGVLSWRRFARTHLVQAAAGGSARKIFWRALAAYLQELLPSVPKDLHTFGALNYTRVRVLRTIAEFLFGQPLRRIRIPEATPVLAYCGHSDGLLRFELPSFYRSYEARLRGICASLEIRRAALDHFGRGPDRRRVAQDVGVWLSSRAGAVSPRLARLH